MRRPAALLATLAVASAQQNLKIRGVNLGGWLVLEQWIKPSLFSEWNAFDKTQPRDQWTYCAALGKKECKRRLEEHWDSWVTESTIADLADAGITHVRIPIGHWITCDIDEDEPYVCGEWTYLQRVAAWCQKYDILVWLDLHTAPGSQNGFDNSGRTGATHWDKSMAHVNRTLRVVEEIATWVSKDEALANVTTGFGLLNEPDAGIDYWRMLHYYEDAYASIRRVLGVEVAVYVGDMFNPKNFNWSAMSQRSSTCGDGVPRRGDRPRRRVEGLPPQVLGQQGQRAPGPEQRGRERVFGLAHLRLLRGRLEGHDAPAAHPPGLQVRAGPPEPVLLGRAAPQSHRAQEVRGRVDGGL